MLEVYDPTRFGGLADAFVKLAEVAAECEGVGVSLRAHLNALYVENEGGRGGWGSVGGLRIDGVVKSGIGAVTEDEEGKAEGMEAEICGARGDDGMSGGHGDGDDEMQAEVGRPAALRIVKERRDSKESESKRRGRVLEVEEESDRMVRESMGLEGWELESERKVFAQIAEKMEYDSRI